VCWCVRPPDGGARALLRSHRDSFEAEAFHTCAAVMSRVHCALEARTAGMHAALAVAGRAAALLQIGACSGHTLARCHRRRRVRRVARDAWCVTVALRAWLSARVRMRLRYTTSRQCNPLPWLAHSSRARQCPSTAAKGRCASRHHNCTRLTKPALRDHAQQMTLRQCWRAHMHSQQAHAPCIRHTSQAPNTTMLATHAAAPTRCTRPNTGACCSSGFARAKRLVAHTHTHQQPQQTRRGPVTRRGSHRHHHYAALTSPFGCGHQP
jgi:hypothetical protein